jgi:hypothetical protein
MPPPGQMKNMFFSDENSSKLCAKGAIKNLLNMLHFLPEDTFFWGIGHIRFVHPHEFIE